MEHKTIIVFAAIIVTGVLTIGLVSLGAELKQLYNEPPIVQSNPEPVLSAVAKTIAVLTDGKATLNILEFRGDSAIVEINGRDTVAYKVR